MIKLIYKPVDTHLGYTAIRDITVELCDDATLTEMLDGFQSFLSAVGYHLDGKLDIIPEEEYYGSNESIGDGGDFSSVHWDEATIDTVEIDLDQERAADDHDGGMLRSGC